MQNHNEPYSMDYWVQLNYSNHYSNIIYYTDSLIPMTTYQLYHINHYITNFWNHLVFFFFSTVDILTNYFDINYQPTWNHLDLPGSSWHFPCSSDFPEKKKKKNIFGDPPFMETTINHYWPSLNIINHY